jgi:hypothetical protein
MKNIFIDTHSVGRVSFDNRTDNNSIKVHFKKYNLNNFSSKSKDEKKEIQSLL